MPCAAIRTARNISVDSIRRDRPSRPAIQPVCIGNPRGDRAPASLGSAHGIQPRIHPMIGSQRRRVAARPRRSALERMLDLEIAIEAAHQRLASAAGRRAQRAAWMHLALLVNSRSNEAVACLEVLSGLREPGLSCAKAARIAPGPRVAPSFAIPPPETPSDAPVVRRERASVSARNSMTPSGARQRAG
jgi:hypothetical protein